MLILIIIVSALLMLLLLIVTAGLVIEKHRSADAITASGHNPRVSVIIPARNEAANLPALLESLERQTYGNFELVLIDDRSDDASLEIMRSFAARTALNVKLIANTDSPEAHNPKVNVLIKGVAAASGDIYLFTDADCIAGPNWIRRYADAFAGEDVGIVTGLLTLTGEKSILCRFQNFDHFYRMLYAFGIIGINSAVGCFGNNFGIRKSAYELTCRYEGLLNSATEDAELISEVKKDGRYRVRALFHPETFIETVHKKTWSEHANQASRWAAGAVFSTNRVAQLGFWGLMIIVLFCLVSIVPATAGAPAFFVFPALMYGFLFISAAVLGLAGAVNDFYWKGLVLSVLLYPVIYVQSFLRAVITRRINWKGTVISWRKKVR